MKVSYLWLKDFVDIKLKPEALAEKLTMAGLSVETLKPVGEDWVFEIEVVSNRPDWLSIRGIAHEVAAVTGARCRPSLTARERLPKKGKPSTAVPLTIKIEDLKDCDVYYGNIIRGVKVAPSPQWLSRRLEACGVRPVNNLVDITNYCLLEYGQPMHAFDLDRFSDPAIVVRRARKGERIVLIDGTQKPLDPGILVIADKRRPVAVAGIMGGQESEVGPKTKTILLESASFNPVLVRRGSRALGLASDSSYRFERGVSLEGVRRAQMAATALLCELCGGQLILTKNAGKTCVPKPHKVRFSLAEACDVLSVPISPAQAKSILHKLGFSTQRRKAGLFDVFVPAHRRDVRIAEDITEELARVYGYDKIPLSEPAIKSSTIKEPKIVGVEQHLKDLIVHAGLKEVITFSLMSQEDYHKTGLKVLDAALALENPLNEGLCILRTTLLPRLLECVANNVNHNNRDMEIFEIARSFVGGQERPSLGIALCGKRRAAWLKEAKPYTFFDLKGVIETVFEALRIEDYHFKAGAWDALAQPGAGCHIVIGKKEAGRLGQVSDAVKKNWGVKTNDDIFVAELFIDVLAASVHAETAFIAPVVTPSIVRDISLLVQEGVSYDQIKEIIEEETGPYLRALSLAEIYKGKELPSGSSGLTLSVEYHSRTKTLTDEEINPIHSRLLQRLTDQLSLTIR